MAVVGRAALAEPGRYGRRADGGGTGEPDPYGVADAANLFYTLNRMPRDPDVRGGLVAALQGMQNPDDGLWHEATHHPLHTTAHCLAALELFDARPLHPLRALDAYRDERGLIAFLEGLEWKERPWNQSHRGAGVFASLLLVDEAPRSWRDAYFGWLERETDPGTGLLRRGCLPGQAEGSRPVHEHMAGTFHYLFNIEADRRPIPHADKLIDTCLAMTEPKLAAPFWYVGFLMMDWVFCLNRARRQCGHRFEEVQEALRATAMRYAEVIRELDHDSHVNFNDLHPLFGTMCAFAEFQLALPGTIVTERPLRNVLDRRPFI